VNKMILGFSGYLIFGKIVFAYNLEGHSFKCPSGLIIGLAYEKITKIVPLFIVLCVVSAMTRVVYQLMPRIF
jgi:hypothetical protein